MRQRLWLRVLAGMAIAAVLAAPGLPVPGADRVGLSGAAAAQEQIDIDTFYDELDPYGQWVWHPRFGYVWLPEDVSPNWRPYTVGRWTYTDEYGWYWDSREPFAWAVYHYGRWGYDPDYGWFWVPGDTWAPAWVQWRYSDNYVGWAPIGPRRNGYAYGVPVSYDPPIAESWVFVQPRYMTSRAISHYAVPIAGLGAVFIGTTNVYRPEFRGGVVYNYGIPRDRVIKYGKRPIYVQKIYRVNDWRHGRYDKDDRNKGIKIYAPGFNKNGRDRGPKRFADNPKDFKPKAKLKDTYKGNLPKGWGNSAKDMKSVAKENPDAFNKKHGKFGPDDEANRGKGDRDRDNDKDNNKDKNQASKGKDDKDGDRSRPGGGPDQFKQGNRDNDKSDKGDKGDNDKNKTFGNQGGPGGLNQFKQGNRDNDKDKGGKGDNDKNNKNGGNNNAKNDAKTPPAPPAPPPIQKVIRDQGTTGGKAATGDSNQGNNDKANKGDDNKNKNVSKRPGGPDQFKQGNRNNDNDRGDKGDRGDNNKNKNKNFGSQGGGGGGANQFKQGGGGGGGGANQFKQGGGGDNQRAQGGGGGGGGDGGGNKDKCKKNPDKPGCQKQN